MSGSAAEGSEAYQTLMQFLYRAPIGLVEATLDGSVTMINPMSARLLMPLSPDGSLDNLFDVLADVAPQLRGLVAAQDSAQGDPMDSVCDGLRIALPPHDPPRDGEPEMLSLSLLKLDAERLMAVLFDVSQDAQRERQRLLRANRTDTLTQMPNRAAARDHVADALRRASADPALHFAVLFLNCDRFKHINDSVGHAVGDTVLGQMAERMKAVLRQRDAVGREDIGSSANSASSVNSANSAHSTSPTQMAARVGGDEFVVVLRNLRRPDDAPLVAKRLLEALSQPYTLTAGPQEGRLLHCGVSIGIVMRPDPGDDADRVLYDAGLAMAEAKRAGGKRCAVFEPAMHRRAHERSATENDLRRALQEQQLFVVYQPVISLHDGSVAGVEALVRWRHPLRGVVPPIEFIAVAEESGLINALGTFVLTQACGQMAQWLALHGAQAPQLLAVNLSRAQLDQPRLVDSVRHALLEAGLPSNRLQLEVTESLAAQDTRVQERLRELKALGLTLALDDFGTGYSSLASLHALPVDVVKIDRSFVCQVGDSLHHRVLIEATIRVAQSLGMATVAEGIETAAQAQALEELGCDKGQGYFYARPLTAEQLEQWLVERQVVGQVVERAVEQAAEQAVRQAA